MSIVPGAFHGFDGIAPGRQPGSSRRRVAKLYAGPLHREHETCPVRTRLILERETGLDPRRPVWENDLRVTIKTIAFSSISFWRLNLPGFHSERRMSA